MHIYKIECYLKIDSIFNNILAIDLVILLLFLL